MLDVRQGSFGNPYSKRQEAMQRGATPRSLGRDTLCCGAQRPSQAKRGDFPFLAAILRCIAAIVAEHRSQNNRRQPALLAPASTNFGHPTVAPGK
jgi:hypothetical protein